jgi:hypothetical protein
VAFAEPADVADHRRGGLFAIVLLVTLFRAERSVANGALTVITLLAIGIAVTTMLRGSGGGASVDLKSAAVSAPSLAALACLDGLAGESVEQPARRRCSPPPIPPQRACPIRLRRFPGSRLSAAL